MKEIVEKINQAIESLQIEMAKAVEGNKAAAGRARKLTLQLEKFGKEFRKESIASAK